MSKLSNIMASDVRCKKQSTCKQRAEEKDNVLHPDESEIPMAEKWRTIN